jgi:hypothetical protein
VSNTRSLISLAREYLRGKYQCTIDLLFDWFGISCTTTDIFCFYLLNRLIQTSQKGGQWYSDTSPFSFPWFSISCLYCQVQFNENFNQKLKIVTTQVTLTNDADFKQGLMVLADVAVDTPAFDVTGLYLNAARVGSR